MSRYDGTVVNLKHHDQDVLNYVLREDVLLIDPAWNYQIYDDISSADIWDQFKIVYYRDRSNMPWEKPEADCAELWWRYANKTPFIKHFTQKQDNKDVKKRKLSLFIQDASKLLSLKISFYRCRLLSKITLGGTKEHYTRKKNDFRKRIKQRKKTEARSSDKYFTLFKIAQNFVRQDYYVFLTASTPK